MAHLSWPLFDLRIRTPRLELRYADDELLDSLAPLVRDGIHEPDRMPFSFPWTRLPPEEAVRSMAQYVWRSRGGLTRDDWVLSFAVLEGGTPVALQDVLATGFGVRRVVETGSWVGRRHQGRGVGTEMRGAVLHLAFAGLGALQAETGCWDDNPASAAVTDKHGYLENGSRLLEREGAPARMLRFRLPRDRWRRRDDITIAGLEPCLPMLGAV